MCTICVMGEAQICTTDVICAMGETQICVEGETQTCIIRVVGEEQIRATDMYSLLHLECDVISISHLNLLGLFSTERGNRDLEN